MRNEVRKWNGRGEWKGTSFISKLVFKSRRLHMSVVNAMSRFGRLRSHFTKVALSVVP